MDAMLIFILIVVVVIFILLRRRRQQAKHVEKTGQYAAYLTACNLLKQNGYELSEDRRKWNEISHFVKKESNPSLVGRMFIVSDPSPGFLGALIGAFSSGYKSHCYHMSSYASMRELLKIAQSRVEREGRNFDYYWPDDSLIGGWCEGEKDDGWLTTLKSAIDGE